MVPALFKDDLHIKKAFAVNVRSSADYWKSMHRSCKSILWYWLLQRLNVVQTDLRFLQSEEY
jgi:hypothetical protein